nr:hypothetical protein 220p1_00149 [Serratia entomophila]
MSGRDVLRSLLSINTATISISSANGSTRYFPLTSLLFFASIRASAMAKMESEAPVFHLMFPLVVCANKATAALIATAIALVPITLWVSFMLTR